MASCIEILELLRIFKRYEDNDNVLVECIAAVGCLADIGTTRIASVLTIICRSDALDN